MTINLKSCFSTKMASKFCFQLLVAFACISSTSVLDAATLNPSHNSFVSGEATTDQFAAIPPFIETAAGKPSVILAFDISGSMLVPAYPEAGVSWSSGTMTNFDPTRTYFGYFDSGTQYRYDAINDFFVEDASLTKGDGTAWDGDFLNWLTMRRVDVARQVMIGGKVRDRNGESIGGSTKYVLEGEKEVRSSDDYTKSYALSSQYSPIPDGRSIKIQDGKIKISGTSNTTAVAVNEHMEIGYLTTSWAKADRYNPANWPSISYLNSYNDPVVIVGSMSYAGYNSTTAAADSVTTSGFKIGMLEWDSVDGNHATENMVYIVAERGEHKIQMSDGSTVLFIAGKKTGSDGLGSAETLGESATLNSTAGKQICYRSPCSSVSDFGTAPVVLAGIATMNDTSSVAGIRAFSINATSFQAALQEEHGADQVRAAKEDVHYIAFEKTSGTTSTGVELIADVFENVDGGANSETFSMPFSRTPIVALTTQTGNDAEPSAPHFGTRSGGTTSGQSSTGITVAVQDSTNGSNESHGNEDVGYLAVYGRDGFNIQLALDAEPQGLVQENSNSVNFGLTVFNFDHKENNVNNIVTGSKVHGQTMYPCYWIYDSARRARRTTEALTDTYSDTVSFSLYDGSNRDYLCVPTSVHSPNEKIVQVIEEYPLIWGTTPIAESLVDVGHMVRQEQPTYKYDTSTNPFASDNDKISNDPRGVFGIDSSGFDTYGFTWDPFYDPFYSSPLKCKKIFALHFNDGAPYKDFDLIDGVDVHAAVKSTALYEDISGDAEGDRDELDSVALALRKNDCRSDLNGHQEVISYFVYAALGQDEQSNTSTRRMREAAARGGFVDSNNNHLPDPMWPVDATGASYNDFNTYAGLGSAKCPETEWDTDGNCEPDTFFLATDGSQIKSKLQAAITDILARVSSGGAASVVSTSSSGTGAIYQANFTPVEDGVTWFGDMYALMVDSSGLIRNDKNGNKKLDSGDEYLDTCFDTGSKKVLIKLSATEAARPTLAQLTACSSTVFDKTWSDVNMLWSGADALSSISDSDIVQQRSYTSTDNQRYIFTAFHTHDGSGADDGLIMGNDTHPFMPASFEEADENNIGLLDASSDAEAAEIVNYIRGLDQAGYRSRDLNGVTKRLGDIIYSTPVAVARPSENFHLLYGENSYGKFLKKYKNRRTVVYVGGNDGLLHAFNGGWLKESSSTPGEYEFLTQYDSSSINWALGQEIWAYAPYNLLPHLKHITSASYGQAEGDHIYFVDGKPRVFDARIFSTATTGTGVSGGQSGQSGVDHVEGWGTVMVVGFRLGGGETTVVENPNAASSAHVEATVRPAYAIFDVTDPEKPPALMREFTDPKLGFSYSGPAPFALDGGKDWYLMMGSGPTATPNAMDEVRSDQNAYLFLLDLKTMKLESGFGSSGVEDTGQATSFIGDMIAADYDLDFTSDGIYFGSVKAVDNAADGLGASDADGLVDDWGGHLSRVRADTSGGTTLWTYTDMLDVGKPVTVRPSISLDANDNRWIHFGTGRFYNELDSIDATAQYLYGVKEPRDFTSAGPFNYGAVDGTKILDVSNVTIEKDTGNFTSGSSLTISPALTSNTVQALDERLMSFADSSKFQSGWKRQLQNGERVLGEAALFGGILTSTSYLPSLVACDFTGTSYLYALRSTTGTAWYKSVIGTETVSGVEEVLDHVIIGETPATTASLHTGTGMDAGTVSAYTQKADTSILRLEQENLESVSSSETSWRELLQ